MAGIKELRQRIKSVGNIKQITKAMEMVASTKLRRFQDRAVQSRPYAEEIAGLIGRLCKSLGDEVAGQPLFAPGSGDKTLVLLVTSDRGLCGAYNANTFRALEDWLERRDGGDVDFFVYGRKGASYLRKRGSTIARVLTDPPMEQVDYRNAALAAGMMRTAYLSGEYRDAYVLFSAFESLVKYVPTVAPFLPLTPEMFAGVVPGVEDVGVAGDVLLEPDALTIFRSIVPRYLETRIYNAVLEALASEYASRRFAMKNATDAATDMQKVLRGIYNRKRQETITKELLDIVGGAEAVR